MTPERDREFMRGALELAERARGLTSPNPMVGAVVVTADGIVGEGFHRAAGEPHAEIEALAAAGPRARGATLYVTLEPCNHRGRTPPCAPSVIAAGVRRVVVAIGDPNPLVGGRGLAALRAAGIQVTAGVLAAEASRQNRAFLTAMREGRPHVTLKGAMTLDGKIADVHGVSQWITGTEARARAHVLRSESDAVIVGVRTVLRDNPRLTVRLERPWPREPYRVVLDSLARTPPQARVIGGATPARALIAVGPEAPAVRVRALEAQGATVLNCPMIADRVDPTAVLAELFAREVRAALVEGGGEVHMAFLEAGLADRVTVFVAPLLIGGRAATSLLGGAGRPLDEAVKLEAVEIERVGPDLLIHGDVVRAIHAPTPGSAADSAGSTRSRTV
jgi:diaminohydroxyphosphoribosylaminopyrimidine deaminase / 5-amino-6-(5-phosphoribosylamino)uracil reductase